MNRSSSSIEQFTFRRWYRIKSLGCSNSGVPQAVQLNTDVMSVPQSSLTDSWHFELVFSKLLLYLIVNNAYLYRIKIVEHLLTIWQFTLWFPNSLCGTRMSFNCMSHHCCVNKNRSRNMFILPNCCNLYRLLFMTTTTNRCHHSIEFTVPLHGCQLWVMWSAPPLLPYCYHVPTTKIWWSINGVPLVVLWES